MTQNPNYNIRIPKKLFFVINFLAGMAVWTPEFQSLLSNFVVVCDENCQKFFLRCDVIIMTWMIHVKKKAPTKPALTPDCVYKSSD